LRGVLTPCQNEVYREDGENNLGGEKRNDGELTALGAEFAGGHAVAGGINKIVAFGYNP
jgi:hypothetical protein